MFIQILIATTLISALSLISIALLSLRKSLLSSITHHLVALAAGTMIGAAFLHLLPESTELLGTEMTFIVVLASFIAFFVIEKVIHWHHCHTVGKHKHSIGYMNLTGDAIHNFIDGLVIAGAFTLDLNLGIVTSLAVALHELPQEIGDFGVLIHSGWDRWKAAKANILISLTMIVGGVAGYFLATHVETVLPYLTAFAAGGFIYISASDLVPELKEETNLTVSFTHLVVFLLGIILIAAFNGAH
jgi:zinc and cadmium transporter